MKKLTALTAFTALLAACASAPKTASSDIDQARTTIETLAREPLAQQAANRDLENARNTLNQAETALQQRKSPEEVAHLAYLARRQAEAGQARVAEARARQEVARAEENRNRVLLESRSREAETAKSQAQQAQEQLKQLQAKQTGRGMIITLGEVLFDTGQATLKPGAALQMDRLAQVLRSNPNTRILIEGHTGSRGPDAYNDELSQRRAQAVADALSARGVPADRYQALGRGKAFPVASNDTAAGRQQNRRVEIVFSDESGRFAQGADEQGTRRR